MSSLGRVSLLGMLLSGMSLAAASHDPPAQPLAAVAQLGSYTKLLEALTSGQAVTIVVDFSQCRVAGTTTPGPQMTGGLPIQGFLSPGRQYIAFADVHETLDAQGERVTEYIRYRVTPEDKVSIRTARLQAGASKASNPLEYLCAMGSAAFFSALAP